VQTSIKKYKKVKRSEENEYSEDEDCCEKA
jgi:hypothetical protein